MARGTTVEEVARIFDVELRTVYRWRSRAATSHPNTTRR
jgi:transposase-like protein